jgi:hypothetical protein
VTPIEVHVPAAPGGVGGVLDAGATVGGMPVVAGPGQPLQEAVLDYLHRLALATGHPVLATIHDERIGFVVPIRVSVDGASEFAGEPVRLETAETPARVPVPAPAPAPSAAVTASAGEPERPRSDKPTHVLRAVEEQPPAGAAPTFPLRAVAESKAGPQLRPEGQPAPHPAQEPPSPAARAGAVPTHVLRAVPETATTRPEPTPGHSFEPAVAGTPQPAAAGRPEVAGQPAPPQRPAPVQQPAPVQETASTGQPAAPVPPAERPPARPGGAVGTFVLRAVPEQALLINATSGPAQQLPAKGASPAGIVSAPTGTFGPPPVTTTPAETDPAPAWKVPETGPDEPKTLRPDFDAEPDPDAYSAPEWKPTPAPWTVPVSEVEEEAKEPPVREFDSVAEAVLAPESGAVPPGGAGGPIAEPMARINAAVKQGRIGEAAGLAEQTVAEATAAFGADHPDVLRLRELTAYIAYLAGDALRSFHLSLDLARLRHRLGDARGAYGNVQSAAAAWRAVRDPIQGLHLGRDLIAVWSELAAGEGPAAHDIDQLERARSRMGRLAERARAAVGERPHTQ